MPEITKLLATFCCGLFFGAALYISLVQHPAALETGNDFAARFFPLMYRRAAILQASLAIFGCISAIAAWLSGAGRQAVVKRRSSHRQRRSVHADRDSTRQRCVASGRSRRVGSRSPSQTLGLSPLGTHCRERIGISIVSHQLQLLSRRRQPSLGPGVPRTLSWIRKMANRCGNGKSLWHTSDISALAEI